MFFLFPYNKNFISILVGVSLLVVFTLVDGALFEVCSSDRVHICVAGGKEDNGGAELIEG